MLMSRALFLIFVCISCLLIRILLNTYFQFSPGSSSAGVLAFVARLDSVILWSFFWSSLLGIAIFLSLTGGCCLPDRPKRSPPPFTIPLAPAGGLAWHPPSSASAQGWSLPMPSLTAAGAAVLELALGLALPLGSRDQALQPAAD